MVMAAMKMAAAFELTVMVVMAVTVRTTAAHRRGEKEG
jgi:hypothetical protein